MTGSEGSRLRLPVPRHGDLVPRTDRISSSVSRNDQDVSVVALGPPDWRDLRAIRLEALRSEPAAYSSSYEETLQWSDEDWRRRLTNCRRLHLLARARGRPIGIVGGYLGSDEGDESVAELFGIYVTSEYRGRG